MIVNSKAVERQRQLNLVFAPPPQLKLTAAFNCRSISFLKYASLDATCSGGWKKFDAYQMNFIVTNYIPAIFLSRILRQSASALRIGQFSIFVEKLRKKRYSFNVTDIRRAILLFYFIHSLQILLD